MALMKWQEEEKKLKAKGFKVTSVRPIKAKQSNSKNETATSSPKQSKQITK